MPIALYKPVGLTPLQAIELLRVQDKSLTTSRLSYAGRLDPMAEGLLLVLKDEENGEREKFQRLDKKYAFKILFGISTDSLDPLGLVRKIDFSKKPEIKSLKIATSALVGTWSQSYPDFSAAKVDGKPLYYWARQGKIKDIKVPEKNITVYSLKMNSFQQYALLDIIENSILNISKVSGDFRQDQIVSKWQRIQKRYRKQKAYVASFQITCSSGTYIRGLVDRIGKEIKIPTMTLEIKRLGIGSFSTETCVRLA